MDEIATKFLLLKLVLLRVEYIKIFWCWFIAIQFINSIIRQNTSLEWRILFILSAQEKELSVQNSFDEVFYCVFCLQTFIFLEIDKSISFALMNHNFSHELNIFISFDVIAYDQVLLYIRMNHACAALMHKEKNKCGLHSVSEYSEEAKSLVKSVCDDRM